MKIVSSFIPPSQNPLRLATTDKTGKTKASGKNQYVSSDGDASVSKRNSQENTTSNHGYKAGTHSYSLSRDSVTLEYLTEAERQLLLELRSRDSESRMFEQQRRAMLGIQVYEKKKKQENDSAVLATVGYEDSTINSEIGNAQVNLGFEDNEQLNINSALFATNGKAVLELIGQNQQYQSEGVAPETYSEALQMVDENPPSAVQNFKEIQEMSSRGELLRLGAYLDIFA